MAKRRPARIGGTRRRITAIAAGFTGNVVEWYDFALYGYMAGILAPLFFPADNPLAGLIATYGVFAAGFLMRPVGAAFFGWFGDKFGRARAMYLSVILMAMPTFLLGCLPTHASIGIWAAVLLTVLRLFQGISVGGEFSSSVTYLVETAPENRRGLAGSWANVGSMVGMLLGAAAATLTIRYGGDLGATGWWRAPFLAGGVVGTLAILSRRHLPTSEHMAKFHAERGETSPLLEAFRTDGKIMVLALIYAAGYSTAFYLIVVYLPEWLAQNAILPRAQALTINTIATATLIPVILLAGWAGDVVMRRRNLVTLAVGVLAVLIWPAYLWMETGGMVAIITAHVVLFTFLAIPLGSGPALFAELFPARHRLSGYSVAFNLGVGILGGLTPMIATSLMDATGRIDAPAWYMVLTGIIAVLALRQMPDHSREPLD